MEQTGGTPSQLQHASQLPQGSGGGGGSGIAGGGSGVAGGSLKTGIIGEGQLQAGQLVH